MSRYRVGGMTSAGWAMALTLHVTFIGVEEKCAVRMERNVHMPTPLQTQFVLAHGGITFRFRFRFYFPHMITLSEMWYHMFKDLKSRTEIL